MVPWDVERRIAWEVATLDDDPRLVANVVGRRVGALPLLADLGGALLLRPDGVVLELEWDTPSEGAPRVASERSRRVGIGVGVIERPWLAALLPPRPRDAVPCPMCRGERRVFPRTARPGEWFVCGACEAQGWVASDEPR
jgi:hypothetical protein